MKTGVDNLRIHAALMQFLFDPDRALALVYPVMNKTFRETCITLQSFAGQLVQQLIKQRFIFTGTRQFQFQFLAAVFPSGQKITGAL